MRHTVRYVNGPLGRWFRARGWAGVTLPLPFYGALVIIWLPPTGEWNVVELRHEVNGHVPQIDEMGTIKYLVTVLWQYARYGHDLAPIEIDACKRADAAHQREDSV